MVFFELGEQECAIVVGNCREEAIKTSSHTGDTSIPQHMTLSSALQSGTAGRTAVWSFILRRRVHAWEDTVHRVLRRHDPSRVNIRDVM